jgi:hypothetical protein
MVAAMRKGEGTDEVDIVEVMNSRSAVASRIKSTRHGPVLFICSPLTCGSGFCLKDFLSRFVDQVLFSYQYILTKTVLYIALRHRGVELTK